MTEIQPFTFPTTGQQVRTISLGDEPWFVAADVTAILGFANGRDAVGRLVDEEDRQEYRRSEAVGIPYPFSDLRIQSVNLVNESGLYSLILRSTVLGAREFKRWVTAEVLPSIRRTGSYAVARFEIPASYAEALELAAKQARELEAVREHVAEIEPAANAWNVLATANGDWSVADAAKLLSRDSGIKTGRDRLFTILHEFGWTYRQTSDRRWRPMQSAIENGRLTELAASHYHPRTGDLVLDPPQVRITVKGIAALHKLLGGQAPVDALVSQ